MANIEAVVFDIDGTLLDTREFIFQAYEHAIEVNGYPVPGRDVIASMIGHKIEECYALFVPNVDPKPLIATHVAFQKQHISLIRAYPGARTVLEALFARGLRIVLWTGRREHVQTALLQGGLADLPYMGIVSADMVQHGKPDPEGLCMALQLAQARPQQAVMIGDAAVDIEAGQRAGVALTIGAAFGFGTRAALDAAKPDYTVESLTDILPIITSISGKE